MPKYLNDDGVSALKDTFVDNIPDGSIGTDLLADGSITTPKLADGSVTLPKLSSALAASIPMTPLADAEIDAITES